MAVFQAGGENLSSSLCITSTGKPDYGLLFPVFCGIKLEKSSIYGYLIIFKCFLLLNDNETGSDYGEL